ncbi:MAG TPA: PEP-CTERM sorting domain-containing protein [Terriglobales bacterium]
MTYLKVCALTVLIIGLSLTASANSSVDFGNSRGTVTAINGGTAISLSNSILTTVSGGPCSAICHGNLGSVTFTTGTLMSGGSLSTGGTFGAGGMITVMGNGKNGVPSGTLFQGTFTSATWTVNALPGGNNVFSFTGTIQGTGAFSGTPAFTIQGSKIVHGNPFAAGGPGSVKWASGDTTAGVVPEPGSLSLLGTGVLGIAAMLRRKLIKT